MIVQDVESNQIQGQICLDFYCFKIGRRNGITIRLEPEKNYPRKRHGYINAWKETSLFAYPEEIREIDF